MPIQSYNKKENIISIYRNILLCELDLIMSFSDYVRGIGNHILEFESNNVAICE